MGNLTNITIKNAAAGRLSDGRGLILAKTDKDRGRWMYRFQHLGRRRDMGLGPWPIISLAQARAERDKWAAVLALGNDPINAREAQRDAERADRDKDDPTFADLVTMVFEARQASLRGGGARGRWRSPLDLYVVPLLGKRRGSTLTQRDIVDALKPIWKDKHPTAVKAIQRTSIVLKSGKRMGFPCEPEIVEAAREMLGIVDHTPTPIAAVPWQAVPRVYANLPNTAGGMCNKWIILTLVRMDAARGALASEVEGDVWTVPASRVKGMKASVRDFRVPLPAPAAAMVGRARALGQDQLFAGLRGPITDAAVEKSLRVLGAAGTPHGFRTSFRTWVQDTRPLLWEVSERVLGHTVGGKTERAYARSDMLDQRRLLMNDWAAYVTGSDPRRTS